MHPRTSTSRETQPKSVAVIGGGISGMTCAFYLLQRGISVDLYEASNGLGGRIAPASLGSKSVCLGGKNIGLKYVELRKFIASIGEPKYEFFGINTARIRNGKLLRLNSEKKMSTILSLARALSFGDLVKLYRLRKLLRARDEFREADCAAMGEYSASLGNPFLSDYFSEKCIESLVRPMTCRMNGAEPHEMKLETFGTNLSMMLDKYEQLSDGFAACFAHLSKAVNFFPNTRVTALLHDAGATICGLQAEGPEGSTAKYYDHVFVTVPAHAAAALLESSFAELAGVLRSVRYFPVATIVAKYSRNIFGEETRALVFDGTTTLSNAGAYGIHDLDIVRYTFSGKAARDLLAKGISIDDLCTLGEETLAKFCNMDDARRVEATGMILRQGLCAYGVNHGNLLASIDSMMKIVRGLGLTGDYFKGVSLENCCRSAKAVVDRYLES